MQSIINKQSVSIDSFIVPSGLNLGTVPNIPTDEGRLAYDPSSNMLYFSDGVTYNALAAASSNVSISNFGSTPNIKGMTLTGPTLNLEPASSIFPGGVSVLPQSFSGVKTFDNSIILPTLSTVGVIHNDSLGVLSTSLIVNADVDALAAIVDTKLATISTAGKVSNSATTATDLNTGLAIVSRDAGGNFTAGTITATLSGSATSFSGPLLGDITGTQAATVVSFVGGVSAVNVATGVNLSLNATSLNVINTIVKRDGTGSFSAGNITSVDENISGNINMSLATSTSVSGVIYKNGVQYLHNFGTRNTFAGVNSGNFTMTGTDNTVYGYTSADLTTSGSRNCSFGSLTFDAATTASDNCAFGYNTLTSIIAGNGNAAYGSGCLTNVVNGNRNTGYGFNSLNSVTNGSDNIALGYNAGETITNGSRNVMINSVLAGNLTSGDDNIFISANAGSPSESAAIRIGTVTQTSCYIAGINGILPSSTLLPMFINPSGQMGTQSFTTGIMHSTAGVISSSLIVNADIAAAAGIVDTKLATISTALKVSNSATTATNLNTANAIVARDASGNFSAGTITATLTGTATNFSGSLSGNVTGTQGATVVATVGGQTAANVAAGVILANAATNLNTASAIVKRDASGNFTAGNITSTTSTVNGILALADSTSSTVGNITKGGVSFLHNFGTGTASIFLGESAGNYTNTGASNIGIGSSALSSLTSGNRNIVIGTSTTQTTGSDNVYIGNSSGANFTPVLGENAMTRIMNIYSGPAATSLAVYCTASGLLTTGASSERFKTNIVSLTEADSNLIKDLRPVMFNYIGEETLRPTYGLIAEEVNKVFPHLSTFDADGVTVRGVAYDGIPILLLKQVQKQQILIDRLMDIVARNNLV